MRKELIGGWFEEPLFVLMAALVMGGIFFGVPAAHASPQELYSSPLDSDAHLVQYNRFENNMNYTTQGINGTIGGGSASYTTGKFGSAWDAGGGVNWISLGTDPASLQISGNKTIIAWINTSYTSNDHYIFDYTSAADTTKGYAFGMSWTGTGVLNYNDGGGASQHWIFGTTDVADGAWHQVAIVASGTKGIFYVDGNSDGSGTIASSVFDTGVVAKIANSYNSKKWHGAIDDFAIFSRALTPADIYDLYTGSGSSSATLSLASSSQYHLDGTTPINEGSSTTEVGVVFGGRLSSTGSSSLQLQVEVEPAGTSFTNAPNVSSSAFVASGATATTTFISPNGSFHWQARASDVLDNTSTWQQFGPSSTSTDFIIASPQKPIYDTPLFSDPALVVYFRFENNMNDSGPHGLNGSLGGGSVSYTTGKSGYAWNANGANWISLGTDPSILQIAGNKTITFWAKTTYISNDHYVFDFTANNPYTEYGYAQGMSWGGTGKSNYNDGGGASQHWIFGSTNWANGNWHHVALVASGTVGTFYLDGSPNGTGTIASSQFITGVVAKIANSYNSKIWQGAIDDFAIFSRALSPTEISNLYTGDWSSSYIGLQQYKSDATTTIAEGGSTTESTVVFGATVYSTGSSTVQLQIEEKPVGVGFSNVANVTSTFVSSWNEATATLSGLANGAYHWQARVVDSNSNASAWQLFGSSGASSDFTIAVPMSAHFDGSSSWAWPASNIAFAATDPWTMELWYRTNTTSSVQDLMDARQSNGTNNKGYLVNWDWNSGIHFFLGCASGTIDFNVASSAANMIGTPYDTNGVWHQVAITKGSGTDSSTFKFYFDGVSAIPTWSGGSQGPISGNCFVSTSTDDLVIGKDGVSTSTSNYLTGDVDEVRFWNSQRSATDTANDWNVEATSTSGLLGLWHFNGTSADLVTGNATSGQTGTPSFATSSPFGHFLMNQYFYPTPAGGGQMLWYPSGTLYSSHISSGSALWSVNGGITIVSTTSLSNANLVVSDVNSSDLSWVAQTSLFSSSTFTAFPTSTLSSIVFNEYQMNGLSMSDDQRLEVAAHEVGHALGLDHSVLGNIMNYYVEDPGLTQLGSQDLIDYDYLKGQHIWGN